MQLSPYLLFDGNCEEAFKFYEQCFGAKIEALTQAQETPAAKQFPAEWQKKIIHGRLVIGDQILLASDAPPGRYRKPQGFSVSLDIQTSEEADRVFNALANGGDVTMPIAETFWAQRFGMVNDRFGIPWMVNCMKAAEKAA